jgi:hypothetical protein
VFHFIVSLINIDSGAKSPFCVFEKNISEKQGLATRLFRGACICFSRTGAFCAGINIASRLPQDHIFTGLEIQGCREISRDVLAAP